MKNADGFETTIPPNPESVPNELKEKIGQQQEQIADPENFEEKLRSKGVELYEDIGSINLVSQIILEKLKSDEGDFVEKLQMADFSDIEIDEFLSAAQKEGGLIEFLSRKLEDEKDLIMARLNNPEFIEGLDRSVSSLKDFVDSVGLTKTVEERWPKVMYAGKIGRMIIRTNKVALFDAHPMANGEYVHEDNTAYMFLVSNEDAPAGKKVLETQIHETIHGISKNEIVDEDGFNINKTGFGESRFNIDDPLQSKDDMRSFNEGITEYFARKFCKGSFVSESRDEHEYDPLVKNLNSIFDRLGIKSSKDRVEIEKEFFDAYIGGDRDVVVDLIKDVLGKFSSQILNKFFNSISDFLQAYDLHKLGAIPKDKVSLNYENLENTGIDIKEFKAEYPFARLVKYDFDPVTFEPIEVEVS